MTYSTGLRFWIEDESRLSANDFPGFDASSTNHQSQRWWAGPCHQRHPGPLLVGTKGGMVQGNKLEGSIFDEGAKLFLP